MSQEDALNAIVASLCDAALDDSRWPAASALIDEVCGVEGNILVYGQDHSHHDVEIFLLRLLYRGERDDEIERDYMEFYYPYDERTPRVRQLPDSKVVHVRELYTTEELKSSPTYNEMMPRGRFQNSLNVRQDGPFGTRIAWGIGDPIDGRDWSSATLDTIERILPHLRQFVSVRQALVDAEALGASAAGLLENSRCCVIQLSRRGRIVGVNGVARDLLRKGDGLCDRAGMLHARLPGDDDNLQALLARALPRIGGRGIGGSMTVTRPSATPRLVVHVNPVEGGDTDFRPLGVAALVLVVDPMRRVRLDPGLVAEALGLTPTEGQVAAQLAEARTVREIAAATGRRESTVRWHVSRICNKLGISRQIELVQLVLSLATLPQPRV